MTEGGQAGSAACFSHSRGWLIPEPVACVHPPPPPPVRRPPLAPPSTHGCERFPALRSHRQPPTPSPYAHRRTALQVSQRKAAGWDAGKDFPEGSGLWTGSRGPFFVSTRCCWLDHRDLQARGLRAECDCYCLSLLYFRTLGPGLRIL